MALQQEELEIKADGSRSIIRPSRLGLARVSILRGGSSPNDSSSEDDRNCGVVSGDSERASAYLPFIDDYIQIPEPIVDYLTLYSGIQAGDLDPKTSPYAGTGRLVSLKTAYKKIWLLLNLGCIFVGHGLLKDFRTINIHVPKKQVIDTVDIYYIKKWGRKLSLKFLSWVLLQEKVQTGNHDSVEDARTALRLWRAWQRFEEEGRAEQMLNDVYRKGRDLGFKVPSMLADRDSEGMLTVGGALAVRGGFSSANSDAGYETSAPPTPKGRVAGLVPVKEGLNAATQ